MVVHLVGNETPKKLTIEEVIELNDSEDREINKFINSASDRGGKL